MATRSERATIALGVLLVLAAAPASGATSLCGAAKVRATGRKLADRFQCYLLGVTAGMPDPACMTRASTRFGASFARAETLGDCVTPGDEGTVESAVDAVVADVDASLGAPSSPAAAQCKVCKLRESRRFSSCIARQIVRGVLDTEIRTAACQAQIFNHFASCEQRGGGACVTVDDAPAIADQLLDFLAQQANQQNVTKPCEDINQLATANATACVNQVSDCIPVANQLVAKVPALCNAICMALGDCPSPQMCVLNQAPVIPPVRTVATMPAGALCPNGEPVHCHSKATFRCTCKCQ